MTVLRANVEYAKQIFNERLGQDYYYGGAWSPDPSDETDCSGLVGEILEAATKGPDMTWGRTVSTESWPYNYDNDEAVDDGTVGPYGTIAGQAPPDAAVIINIHHGGGGVDSHTQCVCDGVVMEDNGDHGVCTTGTGAMSPTDDYWTDQWFLAGPIIDGVITDSTSPLALTALAAQFL